MTTLSTLRLTLAAPALLAAGKDALTATIGGHAVCQYCAVELVRESPYSHGQHDRLCWVPGMLAAVTKAEGENA